MLSAIEQNDTAVFDLIQAEQARQAISIRMIPSENYVSRAVMQATGSCLTNKYAEGYPGRRYYEGQQITDQVENLARDRAKQLFGAEAANVQPHSGSPANFATYCALAEAGSTIMGLSLPHGGHLTHGWKVSFTGMFFNSVQYELDPKTGLMDYDAIAKLAKEHKPKILISGSSAYPRAIDFTKFREIADSIGAYHVCDMAHIAGLIAGKQHMSPVPYADVVTTTTHKTLRGPRGGMILCKEEHLKAINKAVFPGMQGGPHMHTISALAVALGEASSPDFETYAAQIVANAKRLADKLMGYGFDLVSGGTDNHLILIDHAREGGDMEQVVGVYRLLRDDQARAVGQFYSEDEYDLSVLKDSGRKLLELGRSCLHPDYRGGAAMYHLWNALAAYVFEHEIEILFGVASFHGTDTQALAQPLSMLFHNHLAPPDLRVRAQPDHYADMNIVPKDQLDRRAAMVQVPALIKAYLRLGGFVGDGAFIDHDFNTTDVCLIMDTQRMNEKQKSIYTKEVAR